MSTQQQEVSVITRAEVAVQKADQRSLVRRFADRYGVDHDKLLVTLKNTAFKQRTGEVSNEQMMALLVVADQYHLNPFTREIYAFPDKNGGIVPVVGVDGWSRIINEHPNFDGMDFTQSENMVTIEDAKPCPEWIECTMHRKDRSHPTVIREYLDEVYRPPFIKDGRPILGPWQTHTKRFHRHKTVIQTARLAFGFVGIFDPDEAERIIEAEEIDVTPRGDDPELPKVNGKVAPKKLRKIVEGLLEAVKAEDGPGLLQIWNELESEEQLFVWGELRSWERSSIKALQDKANAADCGVNLIGWSLEALNGAKDLKALGAVWNAVQGAYDENGQEVPTDVDTVYQDRKAELVA